MSGPQHPHPPGPSEWPGWWGVQIGPQQIYDVAVATRDQVAALVGQIGTVVSDVADHEVRIRAVEDARPKDRLTGLEERVRSIEARMFPLPVLAALFGAAGLVLSVVNMRGGA